MKKIIIRIFAALISLTVVYLAVCIVFARVAVNKKTVNYLGNSYTVCDYIPNLCISPFSETAFGDYDFVNFCGISFAKEDKNRNFIFVNEILGNIVFKKDSYKIPDSPSLENIDKIIICSPTEDSSKSITDKDEIKTLVNYLQSVSDKVNSTNNNNILIFAVSYYDGGVFNLGSGLCFCKDENSKLYIDAFAGRVEIPENIIKLLSE